MKIIDAHLYECRLKLKRSIGSTDTPVHDRSCLLIELTDETGVTACGEAAPLPGFSQETLNETRSQLESVLPKLIGETAPTGVEKLGSGFTRWLGDFNLSPSARCGVETAVLNLMAGQRGVLLSHLLSEKAPDYIPVNGLIAGSAEDAGRKIRRLLDDSYRTFKLKVGRLDLESDILRVREVSHLTSDKAALRLDANRAWSLENALTFARGVKDCRIEYIEEPLQEPVQLTEFLKDARIPVALDETLCEIDLQELNGVKQIAAVVLKPTLLGGFEKAAAFARAASKLGASVVVTSTFESPVGISCLANFAAAFGTAGAAAGLETVDWFEQQLLTTPISLSGGQIELAQAAEAVKSINRSLLHEIALRESGDE